MDNSKVFLFNELSRRCRLLWAEIRAERSDFYSCVRELISAPHFPKLARKAFEKYHPVSIDSAIDGIIDYIRHGLMEKLPSSPDLSPELEFVRHHLKNMTNANAAQQGDAPEQGSNVDPASQR